MDNSTYAQLSAPFERTYTDPRGMTYISGEQVIERLHQCLGPGYWGYRVLHHWVDWEADEACALGQLTATVDGRDCVIEQFGGQKIHRSRGRVRKFTVPSGPLAGNIYEAGEILALSDDYKGAATDALKKCAMGLGVGLYLARKNADRQATGGQGQARGQQARRRPDATPGAPCVVCGQPLQAVPFPDGVTWTAGQLAFEGRRQCDGQILCWEHFQAAGGKRAA